MNGRTEKGFVFFKTNQMSRLGQDNVNGKLAIVYHQTKDGPGRNELHGKFYRKIFQDARTLNGQVDVKKSLASDADFRPYTWNRWVFLDRRWKAGLAELRQLLKELRVRKTEFLYDFMGLDYKNAPVHMGKPSIYTKRFGYVLIGNESKQDSDSALKFVAHVKKSRGKWGELARAGKWGANAIGRCLHIVANIVYETDRSAEKQQMGFFGSDIRAAAPAAGAVV
jgi:hypothetical protein